MRTTIEIDDELLGQAAARVQAPSRRALIELALRALIRESAHQRLIEAGGTLPASAPPVRRKGP
jgi:Arc/MetJ family transcription regulator